LAVSCYVDQENYFGGESVDMWWGQAQVLRSCEDGDQKYYAEGITLYILVEIYWHSEQIPGCAVRADD